MGSEILIIILFIIAFALIKQNHKVLVFLSLLSIFADNFRIVVGPSLLLANFIGFLIIPIIIKDYRIFSVVKQLYKPLWLEFFYLLILGLIFGFLIPWESINSDYRMWTQRAQGRTIITILRLLNEIVLSYYIVWCFIKGKINLKFIIISICYISSFSLIIGLIDFMFGYRFKETFLYIVPELKDRFLGLNGEPKMFGRNSALAYSIIFSYYLTVNKEKKLIIYIVINAFGVFLSLSASAIILFLFLNLAILYNKFNFKYMVLIFVLLSFIYISLQNQQFFRETTVSKIEKAVYGSDNNVIPNEPQLFKRFDVFDRLALVFLYVNPVYALIGTGPNLISIPASKYIHSLPEYSTFASRGGIDSVPNVLINNVIARSGLVGIILFSLFFIKLYKFSKNDLTGFSTCLVFISLIFNMVYFSIVLSLLTGLIVGIIYIQKKRQLYIFSLKMKN
jgi:hypothetical protein